MTTPTLRKHARVTGDARTTLAAALRKQYEAGASIRLLAAQTGRSYGFIHAILSETPVRRRPPGHQS